MDDKLLRARQLYEALTIGDRLPEDRVLARSPEYRELLTLGISLCQTLGAAGFDRLADQLYGADDSRSVAAARVLRHCWFGVAQLYGKPPQPRRQAGLKPGLQKMSPKQDYVIYYKAEGPLIRRDASPDADDTGLDIADIGGSDAGLPTRHGRPIKLH